eukprot:gb/GFBE01021699.1/.p1 GENE.gb/GFBE01021699.1/~~gb/GFBE01021699.1/.p1  ORF type:complete len:379 (+),score=83.84 gb/GFBE01021699.1/:3-1139(+)
MKEAINKTVRDLRLYQSKSQALENWKAGLPLPEGEALPTQDELSKLEAQIKDLDKELFQIVEEDLEQIFLHIRQSEVSLEAGITGLQQEALQIGLLMEEAQLRRLKEILPVAIEDPAEMCQRLLEMRLAQDLGGMAEQISDLLARYHQYLDQFDEHTQYLEINVAGFRKLLKRHEKQVPQQFHASRKPCLGFHRLVTKSSRQLVDLSVMFGAVLGDALDRMRCLLSSGLHQTESAPRAARIIAQMPESRAPKGLGPECQMVLQIQVQLQEPTLHSMMPNAGPVDFLYPKPNVPADRHQQQQQQQQSAGKNSKNPKQVAASVPPGAPPQALGPKSAGLVLSPAPGKAQGYYAFDDQATMMQGYPYQPQGGLQMMNMAYM